MYHRFRKLVKTSTSLFLEISTFTAEAEFIFSFYRGSAIAKLVGCNALRLDHFESSVTMYVYEEMIDGRKLTEIINQEHENVKYLPGHKIPANVVSKIIATMFFHFIALN